MFVVLGLIILVAAVVVGVAGVFNNVGSGHALAHGFSVFGYHVTGSTGALFLYGIVVGAAAMLGLGLLLAGARRTSRRGRAARRELRQSRGQTAVSQDRDLIGQRESAQAETARSERARADETTRSERARADEAARSETARADETTRAERARADEAARSETARADETTRSERARADETTRAETARTDDETARADEATRSETARADEAARAKTARADEATRAQQNSLPNGHHDPGQGG
jgi:flagellar biosynthesis GTPase FlhF